MGHPPAQRLRRHVDQFHLICLADDLVGHRLPLRHPGDRLDHVVERLHVLDVDVGDDVDARVEELLDILPALRVTAAGDVGVREFVDDRDRGPAREHGVDVHLGERRATVGDLLARDDLQPVEQRGRPGTAMGLDEADDHVGAPVPTPVRLVKGGERLAHARRRTEVDPQSSPTHDVHRAPSPPSWPYPRQTPYRRRAGTGTESGGPAGVWGEAGRDTSRGSEHKNYDVPPFATLTFQINTLDVSMTWNGSYGYTSSIGDRKQPK